MAHQAPQSTGDTPHPTPRSPMGVTVENVPDHSQGGMVRVPSAGPGEHPSGTGVNVTPKHRADKDRRTSGQRTGFPAK